MAMDAVSVVVVMRLVAHPVNSSRAARNVIKCADLAITSQIFILVGGIERRASLCGKIPMAVNGGRWELLFKVFQQREKGGFLFGCPCVLRPHLLVAATDIAHTY